MTKDADGTGFAAHVLDCLAPLGGVASGRFFGGRGLTAGGVQFGMIMSGRVYFVVDDETRPRYEALGSPCFSYSTTKGRVQVRRYHEVPGELLEERDRLVELAREAIAVAGRR
jgi:DNA transformation protein